ncbi:SH3 domain-containing protein [Streptomyces lydicus]|uniref:SH3 domain-containing protein n=1 Tax=Streptomyces lydicus TaxID=47763 RepID=UPI0013E99E77|nr:SH3 domain-containing protein [Streptomyces lydicus]MCZ1012113.1 SH3 domain-containing protein [Streptomyces lydicus]
MTMRNASMHAKTPTRSKTLRRLSVGALALSLLGGVASVEAQAASAASRPPARCTENGPNFWAWIDVNGANLRKGPSTSYASRGSLYENDRLNITCTRGGWYYGKILSSRTGLKGWGWVRHDMVLNHH